MVYHVITPSHKDGDIDTIGISLNLPAGVGFRTGGYFPTSVSAFGSHSCGIDYLGSLKCWGDNAYGQLGIGNVFDQYTPQTVNIGSKTSYRVVGQLHTCAILDDGSLNAGVTICGVNLVWETLRRNMSRKMLIWAKVEMQPVLMLALIIHVRFLMMEV